MLATFILLLYNNAINASAVEAINSFPIGPPLFATRYLSNMLLARTAINASAVKTFHLLTTGRYPLATQSLPLLFCQSAMQPIHRLSKQLIVLTLGAPCWQ